jgi:RNA polymerase sigma-70 factor (ECF subfamily)
MPFGKADSTATRSSLLRRVKNCDDAAGWQEFYDTYKRTVRGMALKSHFSESEADDLVQETFMELANRMPEFEYDRSRGSFKAWLMQLTRWRIIDFARKRQRRRRSSASSSTAIVVGTETVENVPDPAFDFESAWQDEWEANLLLTALETVRRSADPEKFQVFDLYVNKGWEASKVAAAFGIKVQQVYLIKHRLQEMLRLEVQRLQKRLQ